MTSKLSLRRGALAVLLFPFLGLAACATQTGDVDPDVAVETDGVDPSACRTGFCLPPISTSPTIYVPRYCSEICSATSSCETACDGPSGPTTCGGFGTCVACSESLCNSPLKCDTRCKGSDGAVAHCSGWSGSARGDVDMDGLPDTLETELAKKFYPNLNMHCGSYRGWSNGSKGQYYGSNVRCGAIAGAELPAAIRKVGPLSNGWCASGECIEVVYGLPYASDLGDDSTIGEHAGDSEMYAVLLAWRRPTVGYQGAEFATATSYAQALTSAGHWSRIKEFAGAHMCESSTWDSSSFSRPRYLSGGSLKEHALTPSYLWVAEGKNANYFSQSSCNGGGGGMDDCGDNRCLLDRNVGVAKVKNVGELMCHPAPAFDATIPGAGSSVGSCGTANTYNVWSGLKYGTATAYKEKLNQWVIDWGNETYKCN